MRIYIDNTFKEHSVFSHWFNHSWVSNIHLILFGRVGWRALEGLDWEKAQSDSPSGFEFMLHWDKLRDVLEILRAIRPEKRIIVRNYL